MPLAVKFEDTVLRVVADDGLCVVRWSDSPEARHFPVVRAQVQSAAHGSGHAALLNVVDAKGKVPRFNDEVRKAAAKMARDITPFATGTAHVLLLDGFSGAAVRMFLSTLSLLARSSAPTTVHSTVAAGAAWLAQHAPPGWTAPQIEAAYVMACD